MEPDQGLANGRTADAEQTGEIAVQEALSGPEVVRQDQLLQATKDLLRQDLFRAT